MGAIAAERHGLSLESSYSKKEVRQVRMKTIQLARIAARWTRAFLDVRFPVGVGLRTRVR
jgi:hypothetical protein